MKTFAEIANDRLTAHQLAALLLNGPDLPVGVSHEDTASTDEDTFRLSYLFESIRVTNEITHGDDEVVILAMGIDPTTTEAATVAAFNNPAPAQYVASTL